MDIVKEYRAQVFTNEQIGATPVEAHNLAVKSIQALFPMAPTAFFDRYRSAESIPAAAEKVLVKLSDAPVREAEILGESFGMIEVRFSNGFVARVREAQITR
jgi:hypothetical protein